jgi:AMP deaminase
MASPHLISLSRDNSWPVEGFGDLHLSGSEPRIFPGIVSRTQRRDSLARERKSSMSETDDHVSMSASRRGGKRDGAGQSLDGAVVEESAEESDEEMEEAGGMD